LPFEHSDISDGDVDQVIERMRTQQATVGPVDHPAEEGNLVDTSLNCRPVESDPEDLDSYLLNNQPLPVMIKSKDEDSSREWPFPGFSRQLLGVSEGDSLELTHQFPEEDSVDEDYRGKEVLYSVSVEGIRERILPKVDDEFVKTVSDLKTVSELKDQIHEQLSEQKKLEDENSYINKILEKVLEDAEVKFPPQMLENEIDGEIRELEDRLKMQGMDLEMYLGIQDLDQEGLKEQIRPNAEKRILNGLVIGKISEDEDFDINPDEITSEYQTILDDHFGEDEKARKEYLQSGDSIALLNRVSSQIVTQKTLDFLKTLAQGEDISGFLKSQDTNQDGAKEEEDDSQDSEKKKIDTENETSEQE
jgi:trigger factor